MKTTAYIEPQKVDGYTIHTRIPVDITRDADGFYASLENVVFAPPADTPSQAVDWFMDWAIWGFRVYSNNAEKLTPRSKSEMAVFQKYISKGE